MLRTKQTGIRAAWVTVNDWMNSRRVQILPDQVGLQVTVPSCSHCVTCQKRVRQFEKTLASQPEVLHQWKALDDGAYWLFLPRSKGQDPFQLLGEILNIRIS